MSKNTAKEILERIEKFYFEDSERGTLKDILEVFEKERKDAYLSSTDSFFNQKIGYAILSAVYTTVKDYTKLPIHFLFRYFVEDLAPEFETAEGLFLDQKPPKSRYVIAKVSFTTNDIFTLDNFYETILDTYNGVKKGIKKVYKVNLPEITKEDLKLSAQTLSFLKKKKSSFKTLKK